MAEYPLSGICSFRHAIVISVEPGDRTPLEELAPRVQRELHSLARTYLKRGRVNQTLQPTALINEAWLRLLGPSPGINWENRTHFFGIAARLMRIALVDRARERRAMKRGGRRRSTYFRADHRTLP